MNQGTIPVSNIRNILYVEFVQRRICVWLYLLSPPLSGTLFFSQVMLASGTPLISHWKRATPPSSTDMDTGCVWNLGRAEEKTTCEDQMSWGKILDTFFCQHMAT